MVCVCVVSVLSKCDCVSWLRFIVRCRTTGVWFPTVVDLNVFVCLFCGLLCDDIWLVFVCACSSVLVCVCVCPRFNHVLVCVL